MNAARIAGLVALTAAALSAQDAPPPLDPAAALAAVVDLVDPIARAKAARALAPQASLDAWRAAIEAFHPTTEHDPGVTRIEVDLANGSGVERTELFVRVPRHYSPTDAHPLILQAHGTGGSGREQPNLWSDVADAVGAVVVAPSESGANEGYLFSERERQITLAAIRWAQRTFHIDEDRILLSGISRGGHLTWDLALRHPDRFAAIAPMIGSPRLNPGDGQNNLRYLENVATLPIRDLQGMQDDPRMIANLKMAFARLAKLGARDAQLVEFADLGHSFRMDAVDWVAFFGDARRDPCPAHVVRAAARAGEGRAAWLDVLRYDPKLVEETFRLRVRADEWEHLDEAGQRARMQQETDARTARIEGTREAPGRITVASTGVKAFRILVTPEMLDANGKLQVTWNGKLKRMTPKPDAAVMLEEFAARLDRRFVPVAVVDVR